jgi:hypothetical protein
MRKSLFQRHLLSLGILVAALTIVVSAWACVTFFSASGSLDCNGNLKIKVSGFIPSDVAPTASYIVKINGQTFSDNFTITVDNSGNFSGSVTKGVGAFTGSVSVSGTVTVGDSGPVDIVFSPTSLSCPVPPPPPPCEATKTNSSNFNGTPVPAGSFIWFNANFTAHNVPSNGVTIDFTNGDISFKAGGVSQSLAVPNAKITFSPIATCTSTTFDSITNTWMTTVPVSGDDEIFLTGLAWPVPSGGLPGGANPVNFSGTYSAETNAPGLSIQMKWGAAAYSSFTTDYNALQVKAGHQTACGVSNGDHAGTPEGVNSSNTLWKHFVIGGARGGGGSNFTGSWSGTLSIPICP